MPILKPSGNLLIFGNNWEVRYCYEFTNFLDTAKGHSFLIPISEISEAQKLGYGDAGEIKVGNRVGVARFEKPLLLSFVTLIRWKDTSDFLLVEVSSGGNMVFSLIF